MPCEEEISCCCLGEEAESGTLPSKLLYDAHQTTAGLLYLTGNRVCVIVGIVVIGLAGRIPNRCQTAERKKQGSSLDRTAELQSCY